MPEKNEMREKREYLLIRLMSGVLIILILYGVLFNSSAGMMIYDIIVRAATAGSVKQKEGKAVIVLDAGHGGYDPGKVGINGVPEKDINLAIVLFLKTLLEQNDISVILTRDTDKGVELKERVFIMNSNNADMVVSIHQNSYSGENCHGAQVFYYSGSDEGERLAKTVQKALIDNLDNTNSRAAKSNNSYYILKNTALPVVISECGFLSNTAEADKLVSKEYQQKVAWALHLGILQYLNTRPEK